MQGYGFLFGLGVIGGTLLTPWQLLWMVVAGVVLLGPLRFLLLQRQSLTASPFRSWVTAKALLMVLGLSWGCFWLQWQLEHRLPSSLDKSDVVLDLTVISARQAEHWQRLDVSVTGFPQMATGVGFDQSKSRLANLRRLQLNFYFPRRTAHQTPSDRIEFRAGDRVRAEVRLKAVRGLSNGLPFDYEAWVLRKGIDARGYVRRVVSIDSEQNGSARSLRETVIDNRKEAIGEQAWPWVAGLVFGVQDAFDADQWALTQQTGTLHLLVVSGLHMGLMAGLVVGVFLVGQKVVSIIPVLPPRNSIPSRSGFFSVGVAGRLRAFFVILAGAGYLYVAGAGIALQRAWIMLVAAVLILLMVRKLSSTAALSYAFAIILLINPLVYTGAGFGFSIAAVAGLLLFLRGRKLSRWQLLWMPQWIVFVCLLPVMLWWGQGVSPVFLVCNLVAIPLVGFALLPLSLMTALFPGMWWQDVLVWVGDIFWSLLLFASELPFATVRYQPLDVLLVWVFLLVMSWTGVRPVIGMVVTVLCLTLLFSKSASDAGRIVMADVGQGQSVVLTYGSSEGQARSMVVDVGARFSKRFDIGSAVVAPLVWRHGGGEINDLVISHSDLDHAGGWSGLVDTGVLIHCQWYGQIAKADSIPDGVDVRELNDCHGSDRWRQRGDDLFFRFLILPARYHHSDNDASCVVQIRWHGQVILIPGDVSKLAELALLYRYRHELQSDVLIASHHGSRSSTSRRFLDAVNPKQVWVSSGFNNRFGHPHQDVIERIHGSGAELKVTAQNGAIILHPDGRIETQRSGWKPPWRQQ